MFKLAAHAGPGVLFGKYTGARSNIPAEMPVNGPILESVCAENNENYQNILRLSEYRMPEAKSSDF
jgi:hypothetical protein